MDEFQGMEEVIQLRRELEALEREHRELDNEIRSLRNARSPDPLRLRRLEKRGFELKGRILQIKDLLTPDIIA